MAKVEVDNSVGFIGMHGVAQWSWDGASSVGAEAVLARAAENFHVVVHLFPVELRPELELCWRTGSVSASTCVRRN